MTNKLIRVGFIGLNPDSHWAATAHLPALKSLADRFTIVGVANSSLESSRRTADKLNLAHAFASTDELVNSPEVDVVAVTVRVPHHLALVQAALAAGKHVYCEWPLGNGLAEARQLAALAQARGGVAVVGTRARAAVEISYLRQLIADGYVGDVRSTTLIGSGGYWAGEGTADVAYLSDVANGATLQAIPLAHTLAALIEVLGPIGELSARFDSYYNTVTLADTGETIQKTVPDQVMVHGKLVRGAALSVHYRGGNSRGTNLLWEINGTKGDIQVTGTSGHAQMTQLTICGARDAGAALAALSPPASAYAGWPADAAARNVAHMYARMADDIAHGTRTAPTFADAVALHEVVDAMERSALAHP